MAKKKVFSIGVALAEGLEETISSAQNYLGELRIDIIPLKKIELDPENPRDLVINFNDIQNGITSSDIERERKLMELESLQSIASSIKSQGIINPITVYKYGEKYRLIAGERRTLASFLAGKSDIQAKILDNKPDDLKISLLQWIENIERSDLSLWERLKNLEKIVHAQASKKNIPGQQITVTELSHLIGCSKPHAMNYRAVLYAEKELKKLIFENKIKNLEKAALIADIQSATVRQQVIDACLGGATLKQLKHLAEKINTKSKPTKLIENRGRKTILVNLGATKNISVAKLIMDSVLSNQSLIHITENFEKTDWASHRSISENFKQLLKTLEKFYA
jgi:ParB family transcriptional regulator, chromosome partitioning protein